MESLQGGASEASSAAEAAQQQLAAAKEAASRAEAEIAELRSAAEAAQQAADAKAGELAQAQSLLQVCHDECLACRTTCRPDLCKHAKAGLEIQPGNFYVQERSTAFDEASGKVTDLEARAAEAAENATQLMRDKSDLEATLSTLQKTLGAEDPKVINTLRTTPMNRQTCPKEHGQHSAL